MELKGRKEVFAREYLKGDAAGKGQLNGTQAALRAGYSPDSARTIASQLLAEAEVQDRIAELAEARNQALELDANLIIIELLRMLTADVAQAVDDQGRVKNIHEIPIDVRRAISSFEVDTIGSGVVQRTKIKFWSKEKAAELLGKHLTLFKDVLQVEGLDALAQKIHDARQRDASAAALV